MSTSQTPQSRYSFHVFLSFRGEDTRKNFTDHLYTALINAGIRTFRDDDEIRRGENIESELQKGIRESKISLIVFSNDYASSRWCLDELVNILDRRKKEGHTVFPVFYTVSPEDVENQSGSFAEAFVNHEKTGNAETGEKRKVWMEKMEKWRVALKEVAVLEGGMCLAKEVDGHEAKFIEKIIKEILKRLNRTVLRVPSYTVGLESRVKEVNSWLQDESSEVGIGVICGLGGVGKSTVAKVAYNSNYDRFDGNCFLANVRDISEKHHNGPAYLQKQIFESILKGRKEKIYNADEGIVKMKDAIGNKKVFIVFDDVDQLDVLDSLIGTRDWFCRGSKILITTRCEKLLKAHERHMLFKIKELGDDESLKLFSWYAFGQDHPLEEFKVRSTEAIRHCGGLPLALYHLGSFLSGRGMEIWRSKLQKLEAIPHSEVQKNLEISYKSLDDHDQRLFLLIALSFVGKDKDDVIKTLEKCDLHPTVGIQNLIDRSFISIDGENKVMMPPVIQEMGKEIIRRESPDDLSNYLTENNATDADEGDVPSGHVSEDGLVPAVGPNGAKRPYYQDLPEIAILPYLGNSLKRRFVGLLSTFPISGGLKRFFP
ncbi:disease resistance protein RUN1-like [Lycium barbarum]|uniref:disease resistance protein RUN1-like n=1 Tax=Lycium barbarum TaxID=112863 RepID=UPI00293E6FBC|nr:disease resistance protein RUN1-like [Lycium barbarum]